jgi:hypothetical protein
VRHLLGVHQGISTNLKENSNIATSQKMPSEYPTGALQGEHEKKFLHA